MFVIISRFRCTAKISFISLELFQLTKNCFINPASISATLLAFYSGGNVPGECPRPWGDTMQMPPKWPSSLSHGNTKRREVIHISTVYFQLSRLWTATSALN